MCALNNVALIILTLPIVMRSQSLHDELKYHYLVLEELIECTGKGCTTTGPHGLVVPASNLCTYYPPLRLPPEELRRSICEATVSFPSLVMYT